MLFKLRYRKPFGAVDDFIEATDLAEAEQVGRAWCDQQPGYKYIGVTAAIVATAAILPTKAATKAARVGA